MNYPTPRGGTREIYDIAFSSDHDHFARFPELQRWWCGSLRRPADGEDGDWAAHCVFVSRSSLLDSRLEAVVFVRDPELTPAFSYPSSEAFFSLSHSSSLVAIACKLSGPSGNPPFFLCHVLVSGNPPFFLCHVLVSGSPKI